MKLCFGVRQAGRALGRHERRQPSEKIGRPPSNERREIGTPRKAVPDAGLATAGALDRAPFDSPLRPSGSSPMSDSKFGVLAQAFFLRQPDLLRFLKRRVGSQDAPDLLQETYVRVRRYAASEAISNPEAFLFKTASNIAKNHRSRLEMEQRYVDAGDVPENVPEGYPLQDDQFDGQRRVKRLEEAILSLPPRCREVFILLRIEELPAEEVARRLGISRNMVQKHLHLALQRCHDVLE